MTLQFRNNLGFHLRVPFFDKALVLGLLPYTYMFIVFEKKY
jgi:hypothetical protein